MELIRLATMVHDDLDGVIATTTVIIKLIVLEVVVIVSEVFSFADTFSFWQFFLKFLCILNCASQCSQLLFCNCNL